MKQILLLSVISILFYGCMENDPVIKEKQLNISILIDLSDRIKSQNAVSYDIENVKTITEFFKLNMEQLGAYKAQGKIGIFFTPLPTIQDINSIVTKLEINCSKMDSKKRKGVYDSITELYTTNLEKIYQEAVRNNYFPGADIWRFFKDNIDYCIDTDTSYRNILIIFTDGYLYHQNSTFNNGNRFTYLSGNINRYRDNQNWKNLLDNDDFGILTERNDLNNLEVLVLEVKAENYTIDEDILKYCWKKWFEEMNVSHYQVYSSDMPANTKKRIESFFAFQ